MGGLSWSSVDQACRVGRENLRMLLDPNADLQQQSGHACIDWKQCWVGIVRLLNKIRLEAYQSNGLASNNLFPNEASAARCPLWVNCKRCGVSDQCPLYPRKRTCAVQLRMSTLGHKRTCASYSITSSARESTSAGMVNPSARAVLRLMTSSNLVNCRTGRSAGLAPLRTRAV